MFSNHEFSMRRSTSNACHVQQVDIEELQFHFKRNTINKDMSDSSRSSLFEWDYVGIDQRSF